MKRIILTGLMIVAFAGQIWAQNVNPITDSTETLGTSTKKWGRGNIDEFTMESDETLVNTTDDTVELKSNDTNTTFRVEGFEASYGQIVIAADDGDDGATDLAILRMTPGGNLEIVVNDITNTIDGAGLLTMAAGYTATGKLTANAELEANADVDINLSATTHEITIAQTDTTGADGIPMLDINDDRTGSFANTVGEATIVINAAGTHALYIQTGAVEIDTAVTLDGVLTTTADVDNDATGGSTGDGDFTVDGYAQFAGTVELDAKVQCDAELEANADVDINFSATTHEMSITQTDTTGADGIPLINIDDDRTGSFANTVGEATIVLNAAGTHALYIQTGAVEIDTAVTLDGVLTTTADVDNDASGGSTGDPDFSIDGYAKFAGVAEIDGKTQCDAELEANNDVDINLTAGTHEIAITQTDTGGASGVPMLSIDDDRTGANANEAAEASIVITADGTHGLYLETGALQLGQGLFLAYANKTDSYSNTTTDLLLSYDTSAVETNILPEASTVLGQLFIVVLQDDNGDLLVLTDGTDTFDGSNNEITFADAGDSCAVVATAANVFTLLWNIGGTLGTQ